MNAHGTQPVATPLCGDDQQCGDAVDRQGQLTAASTSTHTLAAAERAWPVCVQPPIATPVGAAAAADAARPACAESCPARIVGAHNTAARTTRWRADASAMAGAACRVRVSPIGVVGTNTAWGDRAGGRRSNTGWLWLHINSPVVPHAISISRLLCVEPVLCAWCQQPTDRPAPGTAGDCGQQWRTRRAAFPLTDLSARMALAVAAVMSRGDRQRGAMAAPAPVPAQVVSALRCGRRPAPMPVTLATVAAGRHLGLTVTQRAPVPVASGLSAFLVWGAWESQVPAQPPRGLRGRPRHLWGAPGYPRLQQAAAAPPALPRQRPLSPLRRHVGIEQTTTSCCCSR